MHICFPNIAILEFSTLCFPSICLPDYFVHNGWLQRFGRGSFDSKIEIFYAILINEKDPSANPFFIPCTAVSSYNFGWTFYGSHFFKMAEKLIEYYSIRGTYL